MRRHPATSMLRRRLPGRALAADELAERLERAPDAGEAAGARRGVAALAAEARARSPRRGAAAGAHFGAELVWADCSLYAALCYAITCSGGPRRTVELRAKPCCNWRRTDGAYQPILSRSWS